MTREERGERDLRLLMLIDSINKVGSAHNLNSLIVLNEGKIIYCIATQVLYVRK